MSKTQTQALGLMILVFTLVGIRPQAMANVCEGREKPDLSLVLTMDVSSSMSDEEFNTQLAGYSKALQSERVVSNLMDCLCAEISVVFWSIRQQVMVPFTRMETVGDVKALASFFSDYQTIRKLGVERSETELYQALHFSRLFVDAEATGEMSRVIMISGDGLDSRLVANLENFRDIKASNERSGVTVNGVPINIPIVHQDGDSADAPLSPLAAVYPEVSDFYRKELTTSDGFNVIAKDYRDLQRAMTESLSIVTCNLMM